MTRPRASSSSKEGCSLISISDGWDVPSDPENSSIGQSEIWSSTDKQVLFVRHSTFPDFCPFVSRKGGNARTALLPSSALFCEGMGPPLMVKMEGVLRGACRSSTAWPWGRAGTLERLGGPAKEGLGDAFCQFPGLQTLTAIQFSGIASSLNAVFYRPLGAISRPFAERHDR